MRLQTLRFRDVKASFAFARSCPMTNGGGPHHGANGKKKASAKKRKSRQKEAKRGTKASMLRRNVERQLA